MKESLFKSVCGNKYTIDFFLKFFVNLHNLSYKMVSRVVSFKNNGLHPKHEIMKYYEFFKKNITPENIVLDVGCGNGFVAYNIAQKARKVIGIDIKAKNVEIAKNKYTKANLEFIIGDVTNYQFKQKADVVTLSNVLEHIENRIELLERLKRISPKILIRVPLISRSWIDAYKRENKLKYKLDNTHFIEYYEEEFFEEIKKAGLLVTYSEIRWGELYAVCEKISD